MSSLLWIQAPEVAINIGDGFEMWKSLAEMARKVGADKSMKANEPWAELFSIPQFVDGEDVDEDWLYDVVEQAKRFPRDGLSENTVWILEQIANKVT